MRGLCFSREHVIPSEERGSFCLLFESNERLGKFSNLSEQTQPVANGTDSDQ